MKAILSVLLLFSAVAAFAGEYSADDGEVLESLGNGGYVSTRGRIVQYESMGDGDYLTSAGEPVEKTDDDDYLAGNGSSMRGMGGSGGPADDQ